MSENLFSTIAIVAISVALVVGLLYLANDAGACPVCPCLDSPTPTPTPQTQVITPSECTMAIDNVIVGTSAGEKLRGTSGNDLILGNGGGDTIYGGGGDDCIVAGNAGDYIKGQSGDDVIKSGNGGDYVKGGSGMDRCIVGQLNLSKMKSCELN